LISVFIFDNINGSSISNRYLPVLNFYNGNFAGFTTNSIFSNTFLLNNNLKLDVNKPKLYPQNRESVTFKEYSNDNINNQILIIVESFGLINDSIKRVNFEKDVSFLFQINNWKAKWGRSAFSGSTTHAELRELLNCTGDYRYFLKMQQAKNFLSILNIKKKQGYNTSAIHSYKGSMFERVIWWKNIGADEVYFSENIQAHNRYLRKLNYDSPFTSVNDEDAFDFIQSTSPSKGKQFVYFLTVNGHLPFKRKMQRSKISFLFNIQQETNLSEEAKNQHNRISDFLFHIAANLDSTKFQKVLILGDHMPPFVKKYDRSFYNNHFVPYLILSK
jgi:phosphoglycerol transferase MdoB-like AlkP superfamily enzyme